MGMPGNSHAGSKHRQSTRGDNKIDRRCMRYQLNCFVSRIARSNKNNSEACMDATMQTKL